jgi:hypothetical protein
MIRPNRSIRFVDCWAVIGLTVICGGIGTARSLLVAGNFPLTLTKTTWFN